VKKDQLLGDFDTKSGMSWCLRAGIKRGTMISYPPPYVTLLALARIRREPGRSQVGNWNWRARFTFASHGVRTTIQVTEPASLVPIKLRLPPGWCEVRPMVGEPQYSLVVGNEIAPRGLERLHLLFRGGLLISAAYNLEPVLGALESELDRRIGLNAGPDRVFVDAGAVGWRGNAILLAGPAHHEISTLIAALLRAGASYYSDRYAVLDGNGRVHPYARPLWLSVGAHANPVRYLAEDLGAKTGIYSLPVRTVVFVCYRLGAQARFFPVTRTAAAAELMASAVVSNPDPEAVSATLSKALAGAWILRGICGDPESVLNLLLGPQRKNRRQPRKKKR
jgi:hypothetical protein